MILLGAHGIICALWREWTVSISHCWIVHRRHRRGNRHWTKGGPPQESQTVGQELNGHLWTHTKPLTSSTTLGEHHQMLSFNPFAFCCALLEKELGKLNFPSQMLQVFNWLTSQTIQFGCPMVKVKRWLGTDLCREESLHPEPTGWLATSFTTKQGFDARFFTRCT